MPSVSTEDMEIPEASLRPVKERFQAGLKRFLLNNAQDRARWGLRCRSIWSNNAKTALLFFKRPLPASV